MKRNLFTSGRSSFYLLLAWLMLPVLSACVSTKKYERQMELAGAYQDRYNGLRHDSLIMAMRIDSLEKDSADMQKQIEEMKKGKVTPPVKYYRQQTITDEKEYKLKVIYLYNIANGIEWETKYKKGVFTIGVLGRSPITAVLIKEFANKKKGSQSFNIVEFSNVKDITDCQVLFISKGNYKSIYAVKEKVGTYPTLLISEEDYAAQSAHFNLAVDGDALKMHANRELLKKLKVSVSKSILSSAD